jgi:hypothetical protein
VVSPLVPATRVSKSWIQLAPACDCILGCSCCARKCKTIKSAAIVNLQSRSNKDFDARYPAIAKELSGMPDDTVIGGEVVALD